MISYIILTIHDLMNRYNRTGSVRVRARPGRVRVTTLRPHRVNTSIHPRNRFNQQPLLFGVYGVHAQKIINYFMQITALAFFSMTMQGLTQRVNNHTISCSKWRQRLALACFISSHEPHISRIGWIGSEGQVKSSRGCNKWLQYAPLLALNTYP